MCGIVGAFYFNSLKINSNIREITQSACKTLEHRGPDANAIFINEKLGVALGQSRLKVQDLSDLANQPFFSKDKRYILLFNGQIYNHLKLRKELLNYEFLTNSDTETLLAAYIEWGLLVALNKFEGMFAFSIFDTLEKTLVLVRDRFGIKPLYFSKTPDAIFFASELTALKTISDSKPILSELSIHHFSQILATPAPLTPFLDLFKIPAGFILQTSIEKINVIRWYDLKNNLKSNAFKTNDNINNQVESLLKKSVESHLLSDVPIGIFLSGGIDSSLIAQIAAEKKSITAFHLHFKNKTNFDELEIAKKIASLCKIPLNILTIDEASFVKMQETVLSNIDDLIGDPVCVSFALLSEVAKQMSTKVILVGEGADELFWGYSNYFKHLKLDGFLSKILANIPFASSIIKKCFSGYRGFALERTSLGKFSFLAGAMGFENFSNPFDYNSKEFFNQLNWIHKFFGASDFVLNPLDYSTWHNIYKNKNLNIDQQITYLEFCHRLPELLLMRCDKMGMMFGVEARVPFLDHKFVEAVFSMPLESKTSELNNKIYLKNLFKKQFGFSLNKKIGFSAPFLQQNQVASWNSLLISKFKKF